MCLCCVQLDEFFAKIDLKDPSKNNDLATDMLKFATLESGQKCEFARNYDKSQWEETTDEDVMNGKSNEDRFEETIKPIETLYDIPGVDYQEWRKKQKPAKNLDAKIKELEEHFRKIKSDLAEDPQQVLKTLGVWDKAKEYATGEEPSKECQHDWFDYHGLGTKKSETLCLKCGKTK